MQKKRRGIALATVDDSTNVKRGIALDSKNPRVVWRVHVLRILLPKKAHHPTRQVLHLPTNDAGTNGNNGAVVFAIVPANMDTAGVGATATSFRRLHVVRLSNRQNNRHVAKNLERFPQCSIYILEKIYCENTNHQPL